MTPNEIAIARSVIYASLFDYPLTLDQLHHALLESDQSPSEILATYGFQRTTAARDRVSRWLLLSRRPRRARRRTAAS
jgi:hypothetical protein